MILPSVKAGRRACEIANLDWSMVFDARGTVADTIAVRYAIAKKYAGRRIPMHPDLKRACYDRSCVIATAPARRSAPALYRSQMSQLTGTHPKLPGQAPGGLQMHGAASGLA